MIDALKKIDAEPSSRLYKCSDKFNDLVDALNEKDLTPEISEFINHEIKEINEISEDKLLVKRIQKSYSTIVRKVQKELGYVTKRYYQTLWMPLGMSAFGIPIGMAISFAISDGPAFFSHRIYFWNSDWSNHWLFSRQKSCSRR